MIEETKEAEAKLLGLATGIRNAAEELIWYLRGEQIAVPSDIPVWLWERVKVIWMEGRKAYEIFNETWGPMLQEARMSKQETRVEKAPMTTVQEAMEDIRKNLGALRECAYGVLNFLKDCNLNELEDPDWIGERLRAITGTAVATLEAYQKLWRPEGGVMAPEWVKKHVLETLKLWPLPAVMDAAREMIKLEREEGREETSSCFVEKPVPAPIKAKVPQAVRGDLLNLHARASNALKRNIEQLQPEHVKDTSSSYYNHTDSAARTLLDVVDRLTVLIQNSSSDA